MRDGMEGRLTRRDLLRTTGRAGAAFGLATIGGLSVSAAAPAFGQMPVAGGRKVQLTEFIWIGGGQGVVPRGQGVL
jgi:hypothetical protein